MKNRTGSALLIVLGMLAVMVVSAVGFSAYMRYARLPSSFLRRSSASRQLAKAALAKAIDIVDRSIGNAPHPNVGDSGDAVYVNDWRGRVYIGASTGESVEEDDTVAVLTLEGLAYIPPPLVNEARYYSRHSAAAMWQQFDDFEAGRYAFCAIDVSDYLDVNRMFAGYARNSSPERRIAIAHLFEDADHSSAGSGGAEWDTFMENYRDVGDDFSLSFKSQDKLPLVSLADFNLELGSRGKIGELYSPFYDYVSRGSASFYGGGGGRVTAAAYDVPRRMTFVTDGYFPMAGTNGERMFDLSKIDDQPFLFGGGSANLDDFMNPGTELAKFLRQRISSLGLAALYDYLDDDSVPASLVMPTVERVPMICGIQPNFQSRTITLESEWVPTGDPNSSVYAGLPRAMDGSGTPVDYNVMDGGAVDASTDGDTRKVCRTVKCSIGGLEAALSLGVNVAVVYPFAHGDDESDIDFTIDGRIAVFFTKDSDPMTTRAGTANNNSSDHWRVGNSHIAIPTARADGVSSARLDGRQYSPPDNIDNMNEAVEIVSLPCKAALSLNIAGHPFIYYTRVWNQTFSVNPSTGLGSWNDIGGVDMYTAPIEEVRCAIPPQTSAGISDPTLVGFLPNALLCTGDLKLNLAVWVRVTDESGRKAYDMVPASIQDDAEFNDIYGGGPRGSVICESTFPVMRFDIDTGSVPIPLSPSALPAPGGTPLTLTISPQTAPGGGRSIMVADPRYNYAPESWFATADDLSPTSWLAAINDTLAEGDGDIFMSVSDQGYMQSVYELAFLPRLTNLDDAGAGGSSLRGNCIKASDAGIANFYSGKTQTLNYRLMWKTFDLFDPVEAERMREFNIFQGVHGQRVNPYSDSTNVLMAVFANTPVDWRCASTNNVDELEKMSASRFNSEHAWCGYSSVASQRLEYSDLEQVAGKFIYSIRSGDVGYDWQGAWENLWLADTGEPDQLCGVDLTGSSANIWEADRKFLYGFWRECFAARQQLFLIFVRAEPLMIGGEGIDQASPQLSSRAVALVWRDPAPVAGVGGYPHRTRILFYRPLE